MTNNARLAALKSSRRGRWLALVVLCLGQLVIVVDGTVVNVALPIIERELHFTQASLAWVVNAYLVTFGGLLLLAGRLGDLFGRRRIFLFGLGLFSASSAACGFAESRELLIGARFVQGVGAACCSSMVLGILVTLFPAPRERGRAMIVYALVANIGGSIGLLVGGALTQYLSWHWIFFINVPIGVVGGALALALLDEHPGIGIHGGVDWVGGLLVVAAPTLATWAIVNASAIGWGSTRTVGSFLGAAALGALFLLNEAKVRRPLIPLRLLATRRLGVANLARFFHGFAMSPVFFCGALYLQHVLGYSAIRTGLGYFPLNLMIGLCSLLLVSRILRRFGPSRPIAPGFCLVAAGLLLLARAPLGGNYFTDVMPAFLLVGLGASLVFLPTVTIAMAGAGSNESGLASGLTNVTLQIGIAFGTAVAASISSIETNRRLAAGAPLRLALTAGYHLAFVVTTAAPLLAAGLCLVALRGFGPPAAVPDPAAGRARALVAE
ncbi:MAG TPA: MFS transporter [Acidimicrobiales bacterium]|nr:MFS transporter [Acidimicrobiales bacterium]